MDSSDRIWREQGLKSAVLAGDERAWQTWYEEAFESLYGYISWRSGGRRDLTDEVVQETWLTAVRRIGSFEPLRGSFVDWLRGIAANVLRNRRRQENGRARHFQSLDQEPVATGSGEAGLELQNRAERIARTLAALPERYEAALRAKYLDEQSVAEIAAAWTETPKAIESLLTRARQAFREAYLKSE